MRRLEDNIKTDIKKSRPGVMDLIFVAQDRDRWLVLVNAVMNFGVP
jgi:hypothetical protein